MAAARLLERLLQRWTSSEILVAPFLPTATGVGAPSTPTALLPLSFRLFVSHYFSEHAKFFENRWTFIDFTLAVRVPLLVGKLTTTGVEHRGVWYLTVFH